MKYFVILSCAVWCVSPLASQATAATGPATHFVIEAASEATPRVDTASSAELADGRLMVVYQKYHAGDRSGNDEGYCNIWSKTSDDGGHTWKHPRLLVDVTEGDVNVMNPMLLRLTSNELILICHRYHPPKPSTSKAVVLRSTDGGETFTEEGTIWERPATYRVAIPPLNRLACGRLLLAFSDGKGMGPYQSMTAYSDDNGKTWTESPHRIQLPKRGALEPSIVELPDKSLLMSIRTQLGGPYLSRSTDRGVSWSAPQFSGLEGGESGTCLRRIPNSERLVMFFNNSTYIPEGHHHYGERTPLTVAVSDDQGHHWRILGNLAEEPDTEYTNLDCLFTSSGDAILTYMFAQPAWNRSRIDLRAAIIRGDWLRERHNSLSSNEPAALQRERDLVSSHGSERATSGAGGKMVTFAGKTHVVWQDAMDDGTYVNQVRSFDHASDVWGAPVMLNQGRDNHARPVMTVDASGYLHVVLSGHNSDVTYRRSLRPNNASEWTEPESAGAGTYPSLVAGKDGTLHLTLRNPSRWNGVDLHVKPPGGAWRKQCHLVERDAALSGYGAFHSGLAWGPGHQTLHAVQDFYESKEVMDQRGVHQAVCYMRSRDGGQTWEKADQTRIELPARPERMDTLAQSRGTRHEPMPPPVILAQGSIVVDANDRPHVLYISHLQQPGQAIHATTNDSGAWEQQPIRVLTEAYPHHRPIDCRGSWSIDSAGTLYALLELVPYPDGWVQGKPSRAMKFSPSGKRLVWLISRNGGRSFSTTLALDEGLVFNQPNAERPTGFNPIPSSRFPHFVYFDGESRYREEGEILQNNVFFTRTTRR